MKKLISCILISFFVWVIILNSFEIIEGIKFSFNLCWNSLFPSLIPFMLLSNILINYDIINDLSDIFKNLTKKIFNVNKNCSFAIIMSFFSGTPSNAKYLKDALDKKLIELNDVSKCLNFCHFINPLFIINTIGINFLNNKKIGLIILIAHYSSSILLGLFNKKKSEKEVIFEYKNNKTNFLKILNSSIINVINTLLLICGIITTYIIITCIIDNFLLLKTNFKFVYGIIEMTQGLKYLALSTFNIKIKAMLSSFIISFGGICVHTQVFCILDNKKIRYIPYLKSRLLHAIFSTLFTFTILELIDIV